MKKALQNEINTLQPISYIASTKLNICAILSQLQRHDKAIIFATSAISDLSITLQIVRVKKMEDEEQKQQAMAESNLKLIDLKIPESNEESLTQTLGIAHYNLGVEYEHSGSFEKAKENYLTAQDFAFISVNTEHLKAQIS